MFPGEDGFSQIFVRQSSTTDGRGYRKGGNLLKNTYMRGGGKSSTAKTLTLEGGKNPTDLLSLRFVKAADICALISLLIGRHSF